MEKRLAESLSLKIATVGDQVRENGLSHTGLCHVTDLIYSINSTEIKTAELFITKRHARLNGFLALAGFFHPYFSSCLSEGCLHQPVTGHTGTGQWETQILHLLWPNLSYWVLIARLCRAAFRDKTG